jgi:hypothetical protein
MAIEWALLFVKAINIFSTNYLMFSILNMFQAAGGLGMHTVQHYQQVLFFTEMFRNFSSYIFW